MRRTAALALALALALAPAAPAGADTSYVGPGRCDPRGTTNYYVHLGDPIDPEEILDSPYVFRENKCEVNGFRLYKSVSNTRGEARFARRFLREDTAHSKAPVVYCRSARDHAYFLDLAFYWGLFGVKHRNRAEKARYAPWARAYARRHGCHLFVPRSS
jgi:hypothetical protein